MPTPPPIPILPRPRLPDAGPFPRTDRIGRIRALSTGQVPDKYIPLDDQPRLRTVIIQDTINPGPGDDDIWTSPLVGAGSEVKSVRVKNILREAIHDDYGWSLYFTRSIPSTPSELTPADRVYPPYEDSSAAMVAEIAWSNDSLSTTKPKDRIRNFPGYYTFRFQTASGLFPQLEFRVEILDTDLNK